jgi:UDP-N-acetylmuramoylalanine--D-glutamate ligase
MNIDGIQKVCVVGWGKSGVALCDLLISLNKTVVVSEAKNKSDFNEDLVNSYQQKKVKFYFGSNDICALDGAQLIVLSPGVDPKKCPIAIGALSRGIACVGELEFAYWFTDAKIIAITGTNGKTTTTNLIYNLLRTHKKRVFMGGNIGTPFSSFVRETKKDDIIVLEVSSFQMETILEFRAHVAVILNIEPDHMDRYSDFQEYLLAKVNIFKNQKENDWAIINKNSFCRKEIEKKINSQIVYFSNEFENENFSCVWRVAKIFGLSKADCLKTFAEFKGLPHRLEFVRKIDNILFINDSKATNPSSTIWALKNIKDPVILLAGGKDKGLDYSCLREHLRGVKKINAFGQAAAKIKKALGDAVAFEVFSTLDEATVISFKEAAFGDVVLLSPMCASFDAFRDYQHRGEHFVNTVKTL